SAFWRVALAGPMLLLLLPFSGGADAAVCRARRAWLLLPGLFFAGDLAVWHESIVRTSAANTTLEANLAVVLVCLVGWLWLKERVTPLFALGGVLAVAGAAVLLGVSVGVSARQLKGDALGLLTAVFYAAYLLSVKVLRARHSALLIMATASVVCALALLPYVGER
nr:DMT family transporter [Armatimonadota bacterium]